MNSKDHWEKVYSTKATNAVSWFQEHADMSLALIRATGVALTGSIVDVGGGASTLVDDLLTAGYSSLNVLDLSATALSKARARLGLRSDSVTWLEGDITELPLAAHAFDLWHDRAVFHFLTAPEARHAYVNTVLKAVRPGGHVIVATFAADGPTQCSGLPVVRYSAPQLSAEFGPSFTLVSEVQEKHHTPFSTTQKFIYCHFRRERIAHEFSKFAAE